MAMATFALDKYNVNCQNLPVPVNAPDVRQLDAILAEQAAMNNKDAVVQDVCQGKPAEGVSKKLNHLV